MQSHSTNMNPLTCTTHSARCRGGIRARPQLLPAFTLLELMIAIGILGVGLIMVASVFPVALAHHRAATESAIAQRLAHRAASILSSRAGQGQLFIPPPNNLTTASNPPPPRPAYWPVPVRWYVVPSEILPVAGAGNPQGDWPLDLSNPSRAGMEPSLYYFNRLSGFRTIANQTPLADTNSLLLSRFDTLDGAPPVNDVSRDPVTRYCWYGFYSSGQGPAAGGNGTAATGVSFAAAVCRAAGNQQYAFQNFAASLDTESTRWSSYNSLTIGNPTASIRYSRFPVPWRVDVKRMSQVPGAPNSRVLQNTDGLGSLAPIGSKMFDAYSGQVYTVTRVGSMSGGEFVSELLDNNGFYSAVEIREPDSLLPVRRDPAQPNDTALFQVYLFPPAIGTDAGGNPTTFGVEPPVIDFYLL